MTELVAVACVVESSLVLASEWSRVLVDYISPLLKRLSEAHTVGSQSTFRMAFVTYGTADTRPTPLLAKRFFVPFQTQVTKELCEQTKNLGIGLTGSGGTKGMAALEGLVTAVELFDTLRTSIETKPLQSQSTTQPRDTPHQIPRLVCHILLVAASAADNAQRPLWNNSPNLDEVSWETLPAELKKRNINLSVINIRPNTMFTELHSSAATNGVIPPWFKVRPPHNLLLTGFPAEAKPKRPAENQASPETKRARVSQVSQPSSEPSPNIPNSSPASVSSAQPAPTAPLQPPSAKTLANQSIAPSVQLSPQQLMAKLRQMEADVQKLTQEHSVAVTQNRLEAALLLKKEKDIKVMTLERFKQAMTAAFTRSQQHHARTNSQGQGQSANISAPSNAQAPPHHLQVPTTTGGIKAHDNPRGPDQQALIQLMQSRSGTNQNSLPAMPGFPNATPELVSQMQKLIDNQGIRPQQPPSLPQPIQQNQPAVIAAPASAQQQSSPRSTTVWEGSLTWTGFDFTTHDRKELHAGVKVTSSTGDAMPKTWPSALMLTPSRDPAVSVQDLQVWAKRTKAVLCTFQAHPRGLDQQTNERNVRSLVELLIQKRIYALAAWTLPSGTQSTNNLLIFPFNGNSLVGIVFPTTGIPEMPKPFMQQLPPAIMAQLQRLTLEQRNLVIAQMIRSRSQSQHPQPPPPQPQFQSQQPQQPPNYNPGQPNFGDSGRFDTTNLQGNFTAMNLLGNTQPGLNLNMNGMMSMMASQQGGMGEMHRRTPSGSAMSQAGGVSYEMLQSFMQRNGDGSGGAGMGPN